MTALSTAEAALRRMPDDPEQPVTLSGAEAAALVRELDGLREVQQRADEVVRTATRQAITERVLAVRPASFHALESALATRDA